MKTKELILKGLRFLANVHKMHTEESAKRFYGGIIVLASLTFIALWRHDLVSDAFYTGCSMIVAGTIAKKFENKNKSAK